jgi:prepilin-type N-terminal cleavage/methylation domain-containing protein
MSSNNLVDGQPGKAPWLAFFIAVLFNSLRGFSCTKRLFCKEECQMSRLTVSPSGGFTLIELIIAVAVLSVVLSGAHSWFANHTIRTKIGVALSVAVSAKKSILINCTEEPGIAALESSLIGHSSSKSLYVENLTLSGTCASPVITVITANTGLLIDPTLIITGDKSIGKGQLSWTCASDGLDIHVPDACHS